jgi:hypothetical protein
MKPDLNILVRNTIPELLKSITHKYLLTFLTKCSSPSEQGGQAAEMRLFLCKQFANKSRVSENLMLKPFFNLKHFADD